MFWPPTSQDAGAQRRAASPGAAIPRRYPALIWRRPTIIWGPAALVLALGWPFLALREQSSLAFIAAVTGAVALLGGLVTLGVLWLFGQPPRTRRTVVLHVLAAGAVAALAAPFFVTDAGMSFALAPFALMLGLPIALFGGLVLSWVALIKPPRPSRLAALQLDKTDSDLGPYIAVRDIESIN